jgi:hypothetical protein
MTPLTEGDLEMKRLTCIFGLVCAFAALSIAPSAASAAINYRVCNGPAPIRSGAEAGASVIGYLQNGEVFEAKQNSANNFDHGWAYGSVHAEGFMNRNYEC